MTVEDEVDVRGKMIWRDAFGIMHTTVTNYLSV